MSVDRANVLVVGVGGQGVVLSSAVIADAARREGFDVKQSEVHGMSQRGGVVSSHLRFGPAVASPIIGTGEADALVALEWNEALRALRALRPGGTLIVNVQRIRPPSAFRDRQSGDVAYPDVAVAGLRGRAADVRACDAVEIAGRAGNVKAMNSVLLGMLAQVLPFSESAWDEALAQHVPQKSAAVNRAAFGIGRGLRYPEESLRLAETAPVRASGGTPRARSVADLEIVDAWCKGEECGICVRACPEYCLGFDDDAAAVRVARPGACTGCRICELLCPDFAIIVRTAVPA